VLAPCADVAIEGLSDLPTECDRPRSATLAEHDQGLVVPIDVLDGEAGNLGQTDARVNQEHGDCRVPSLIEADAGHRCQELAELVVSQDGRRSVGDGGGFMRVMGDSLISPSSTSHRKNCWSDR
jgi:hypothetical protein